MINQKGAQCTVNKESCGERFHERVIPLDGSSSKEFFNHVLVFSGKDLDWKVFRILIRDENLKVFLDLFQRNSKPNHRFSFSLHMSIEEETKAQKSPLAAFTPEDELDDIPDLVTTLDVDAFKIDPEHCGERENNNTSGMRTSDFDPGYDVPIWRGGEILPYPIYRSQQRNVMEAMKYHIRSLDPSSETFTSLYRDLGNLKFHHTTAYLLDYMRTIRDSDKVINGQDQATR